MSEVVPLAEAEDESRFGAKATGLGAAARAGLPSPPGLALSGAFVDEIAAGSKPAIEELMSPLRRPAGESPYKLQAEIQDVMSMHAPIVRDEQGLEEGLRKIGQIGARCSSCGTGGSDDLRFNPGWHTAYDLRSMLVNAEALLRSALARKESRGAHARSDFPKTDDQLATVNFLVEKTAQGMRVTSENQPPMPAYLAEAVRHAYARYTPEETE